MSIVDRVSVGDARVGELPQPVTEALRDMSPFLLALVPFSLAIGAASAAAGFSFAEAMFPVFAIFAGSAQLAGVESTRTGNGILITVLIVLLVNARFAFYGAGLARWFVGVPRWKSLLLAIPLVDQTFLLCQERFSEQADVDWRVRYYGTVTAGLVLCFATCQLIGFQFGGNLPPTLGLHLAAPLAFAGMLAKSTKERSALITACVSGCVVVVASGFFGALALPVAVVAGIVVGSKPIATTNLDIERTS
ncbi:MAG: AzlC family ABC transporter permease [Acidimicrobiia bacterium]|nr:AzlC family ABC transporter permease [Acidimicrobiia bacterium]